jgi:integrase
MNFSPQMIEKYISNGKVVRDIKYRQVKTNQQILSGIYENTPMYRTLKRLGWTFPPKISSQKYNDYLKEIGKLAGLDDVVEGDKIDPNTKRKVRGRFKKFELLTSHIGRRSFATNYYGKIPTSDLMVLTGHKSEGMLLKYIRKSGEEKNVEAVNKVRKWLHS